MCMTRNRRYFLSFFLIFSTTINRTNRTVILFRISFFLFLFYLCLCIGCCFDYDDSCESGGNLILVCTTNRIDSFSRKFNEEKKARRKTFSSCSSSLDVVSETKSDHYFFSLSIRCRSECKYMPNSKEDKTMVTRMLINFFLSLCLSLAILFYVFDRC